MFFSKENHDGIECNMGRILLPFVHLNVSFLVAYLDIFDPLSALWIYKLAHMQAKHVQ